jgi:predicted secreted protein with PEFG-CTERM motif
MNGAAIAVVMSAILSFLAAGLQPSAAQSPEAAPPVNVKTDNESVNVVIDWKPAEIGTGQDVEFTLDFQHPSSGQSISHVNYNFEVQDESGNIVESFTDMHTHSGSDVQTVAFDATGSFELVVTVIGTGINPPFDTTRSGTAETAIMVVPEFPIASVILAAAIGLGIVLARKLRRN